MKNFTICLLLCLIIIIHCTPILSSDNDPYLYHLGLSVQLKNYQISGPGIIGVRSPFNITSPSYLTIDPSTANGDYGTMGGAFEVQFPQSPLGISIGFGTVPKFTVIELNGIYHFTLFSQNQLLIALCPTLGIAYNALEIGAFAEGNESILYSPSGQLQVQDQFSVSGFRLNGVLNIKLGYYVIPNVLIYCDVGFAASLVEWYSEQTNGDFVPHFFDLSNNQQLDGYPQIKNNGIQYQFGIKLVKVDWFVPFLNPTIKWEDLDIPDDSYRL